MKPIKSNIFSIKPITIVLVALTILLGLTVLTACRADQPSPSAVPATLTATGETSALVPSPEATQNPVDSNGNPRPTNTRVTPRPNEELPATETPAPPGATATAAPTNTRTPRPKVTFVFETDESGYPVYPTDENGNTYFPTDEYGEVIIATDEVGFPVFPLDEEGFFINPTDQSGVPIFATDEYGDIDYNQFLDLEESGDEEFLEEPTPEEEPTDEQILEPTDEVTPRPGTTRSSPRTTPQPQDTPIPGSPMDRTPILWLTPTSTEPLGTQNNPLVIGIVVTKEEDLPREDGMMALAERLSEDTGKVFHVKRTGSYAELLNGMRAGQVHMAWLQPFTYIIAKQRGYADAVLITNHYGLEAYGTLFLANESSQFTPFYDPITGKSTGSAEDALSQFAGGKPCLVDPMSASGYVVPAGLLVKNNVDFLDPLFLMSHTGVVRALYLPGLCNFGATFGITGDPRTSQALQDDLPDVMDKIQIIWQSDPIIPNLNLSLQSRLPEELRVEIIEALIDLSQTDEGKQMLTDANAYDIRGLREIGDRFYEPLRELVNLSGVNIRTLIGK